MNLEDEHIKVVVREAVSSAVKETLTSLGIDASDAIKTQTHMAAVREISEMLDDDEFKADLVYLRRWRKSMEQASNVTSKTVFGMVVTGLITLAILGFRQWIGR